MSSNAILPNYIADFYLEILFCRLCSGYMKGHRLFCHDVTVIVRDNSPVTTTHDNICFSPKSISVEHYKKCPLAIYTYNELIRKWYIWLMAKILLQNKNTNYECFAFLDGADKNQ